MTKNQLVHPYVYCGLGRNHNKFTHTNTIIISVAESLNLEPKTIISKSRHREIVEARQLCMFFIRNLKEIPYMKIGKMFHRDHATVIHAVNQVKNLLEWDSTFREKYWRVANDLANFNIHNEQLIKFYEDEKR